MNNLFDRIVSAICREEGMPADYTNPGNLRAAPWLTNPVIEKNFWKPESRVQGIAGIYHVVALHVAKGESLATLINIWAPPSENNTASYIQNVKAWAGIADEHAPLWTYL